MTLSPYLIDVAPLLTSLIIALVSSLSPSSSSDKAAKAVSLCLDTLSTCPISEWGTLIDVSSLLRQYLRSKTRPNASVLGGFVHLIEASSPCKRIPFMEIYPFLRDCLLSHSQKMRLSVLQLLAPSAIQPPAKEDKEDSVMAVLKVCIKAEQVSLDVQGVRERVVGIGKVAKTLLSLSRNAKENEVEGIEVEICVHWLICTFFFFDLLAMLKPLISTT